VRETQYSVAARKLALRSLKVCLCSRSRISLAGAKNGNVVILSCARAMTIASSPLKTVKRKRALTTPPSATAIASKTIAPSSPMGAPEDSRTRQRILITWPTFTTYSSPAWRGSVAGGTTEVVTSLPLIVLSDLHSPHVGRRYCGST